MTLPVLDNDDDDDEAMFDSIAALCAANNWGPEVEAQIRADTERSMRAPPTLH